jgi:hypothetical protein
VWVTLKPVALIADKEESSKIRKKNWNKQPGP